MISGIPSDGHSVVSGPRTKRTKSSCDAAVDSGPERGVVHYGKGGHAGHYILLVPELEAALQEYAGRGSVSPETIIAEALRAYLGIEDGVVS